MRALVMVLLVSVFLFGCLGQETSSEKTMSDAEINKAFDIIMFDCSICMTVVEYCPFKDETICKEYLLDVSSAISGMTSSCPATPNLF